PEGSCGGLLLTSSFPVAASKTCRVESPLTASRSPSGLKATDQALLAMFQCLTSLPPLKSHNLSVWSELAVARCCPSRLKETPTTGEVWPSSVLNNVNVLLNSFSPGFG